MYCFHNASLREKSRLASVDLLCYQYGLRRKNKGGWAMGQSIRYANCFSLLYNKTRALEYVLRKPSYCPCRSCTSHEIIPHVPRENCWVLQTKSKEGNLSPRINRNEKDNEKRQWSEGFDRSQEQISSEEEGKKEEERRTRERGSQYTAEYKTYLGKQREHE